MCLQGDHKPKVKDCETRTIDFRRFQMQRKMKNADHKFESSIGRSKKEKWSHNKKFRINEKDCEKLEEKVVSLRKELEKSKNQLSKYLKFGKSLRWDYMQSGCIAHENLHWIQ